MNYADFTFNDRNPVKRWLQRRRLQCAMQLASATSHPRIVLDFGAGNGELCKPLARQFPTAGIICYEPAQRWMKEAQVNLAGLSQVTFCDDLQSVPGGSIDLLFCLEVLEHLPEEATTAALDEFERLLSKQGVAVIGVPVEIGLPALYKGCFRMGRRYGKYDARPGHVLRATFASPPKDRPIREIAPGVWYHSHHLGYDFRRTRQQLAQRFDLIDSACSPFRILGTAVNPEAYFVVKKRGSALSRSQSTRHSQGKAA